MKKIALLIVLIILVLPSSLQAEWIVIEEEDPLTKDLFLVLMKEGGTAGSVLAVRYEDGNPQVMVGFEGRSIQPFQMAQWRFDESKIQTGFWMTLSGDPEEIAIYADGFDMPDNEMYLFMVREFISSLIKADELVIRVETTGINVVDGVFDSSQFEEVVRPYIDYFDISLKEVDL